MVEEICCRFKHELDHKQTQPGSPLARGEQSTLFTSVAEIWEISPTDKNAIFPTLMNNNQQHPAPANSLPNVMEPQPPTQHSTVTTWAITPRSRPGLTLSPDLSAIIADHILKSNPPYTEMQQGAWAGFIRIKFTPFWLYQPSEAKSKFWIMIRQDVWVILYLSMQRNFIQRVHFCWSDHD